MPVGSAPKSLAASTSAADEGVPTMPGTAQMLVPFWLVQVTPPGNPILRVRLPPSFCPQAASPPHAYKYVTVDTGAGPAGSVIRDTTLPRHIPHGGGVHPTPTR